MPQKDYKVTTHASKIFQSDYANQADLIQGEPDYWLVCLTPGSVWLLSSLLAFQELYRNRWVNYPSVSNRDELIADTWFALECPMACQDDIQAINTTLQNISLTLIEMRDRLGGPTADLSVDLNAIKTAIDAVNTSVGTLDIADLIDQIEPLLDGVGVILGAPAIPIP